PKWLVVFNCWCGPALRHAAYCRVILRRFRRILFVAVSCSYFAKNRRKVEHCGRPSRRRFQSQLGWADLYASRGGETSHLSRFDFYRLLRPWPFLAHLSRLVRSHHPLNVAQSLPYHLRDFLNPARVGCVTVVHL